MTDLHSSTFKKMIFTRLLAENVLVFLLQYTGLMFSTLSPHPAPIWFATGTACGFIMMRSPTILPGIFLGTLLAYALAHFTIYTAFIHAMAFSLQAFLFYKICHHYSILTLIFYDKKTFFKFLLISIFITGCFSLITGGFLANLNGILIVACALMTWDAYFPQIYLLKPLNRWKLITTYGLLLLFILGLVLHIFPALCAVLIWIITYSIKKYYGLCGAIAAAFLCSLCVSLGVTIPHLVLLQLFLCAEIMLALFPLQNQP